MITPAEFPVPLIILPETDSTNNYLTQLCDEQQSAIREFTTIIAERQTAGKGNVATVGNRKIAGTSHSAS